METKKIKGGIQRRGGKEDEKDKETEEKSQTLHDGSGDARRTTTQISEKCLGVHCQRFFLICLFLSFAPQQKGRFLP